MNVLVMRHILVLVGSFFFAYCLVPFFTQVARYLGFMDQPDGAIKNHKTPVPYMGGLAIYSAFLITIAFFYPIADRIVWLIVGSTLLMIVGCIDDLKRIKPLSKLLGQFLGVACLLYGGFIIKQTFFASFVNILLTGFWMLSLINAVNLIDVMDGLATTTAIIAAFGFCCVALLNEQYVVSLLLVAFIGSLIGFLYYNKPPAKIYMGDAGSLFIGGFLASAPLLIKWSLLRPNAFYSALIIPAIPLIEVFCLVVIRTYKGIPFYRGSPHHFSIYLQNKGWSRRSILIFTACMGLYLVAVSMAFLLMWIDLLLLVLFGVLFCATWYGLVFSSLYVYPKSKRFLSFTPAQSAALSNAIKSQTAQNTEIIHTRDAQ